MDCRMPQLMLSSLTPLVRPNDSSSVWSWASVSFLTFEMKSHSSSNLLDT